MSVTTIEPGAINGGADDRANLITKFAGEVIVAFEAAAIMNDERRITIQSATQAGAIQFPVVGKSASASYVTPGAALTGSSVYSNSVTITADPVIASHIIVDVAEELLSAYDLRSTFSKQIGEELARKFDQNVFLEMYTAAGSSATVSGGDGGYAPAAVANLAATSTDANFYTAWTDALSAAAANFDTKFVGVGSERFCYVPSAVYRKMSKAWSSTGASMVSKDVGGMGSISRGDVTEYAGFYIVNTPQLPVGDYTSGTLANSAHGENTTNLIGLLGTKDAVGVGMWRPTAFKTQEVDLYTKLIGYYLAGVGVLRPEAAGRFTVA
jgi:hypothetical protein